MVSFAVNIESLGNWIVSQWKQNIDKCEGTLFALVIYVLVKIVNKTAIRLGRKKDFVAETLTLRKMCAQKLGYELLFLR